MQSRQWVFFFLGLLSRLSTLEVDQYKPHPRRIYCSLCYEQRVLAVCNFRLREFADCKRLFCNEMDNQIYFNFNAHGQAYKRNLVKTKELVTKEKAEFGIACLDCQ